MSSIVRSALAAVLLLLSIGACAGEAVPAAEDPALEQRVTAVSSELRCLVCQNQTIAESNAGLAIDLKNEIREKMRRGESDKQIVDFMVARYGDFVLYRPPVKPQTVLLWFGPLLLVLTGLVVLYRKLKAHTAASAPQLSDADRARAAQLLDENESNAT